MPSIHITPKLMVSLPSVWNTYLIYLQNYFFLTFLSFSINCFISSDFTFMLTLFTTSLAVMSVIVSYSTRLFFFKVSPEAAKSTITSDNPTSGANSTEP